MIFFVHFECWLVLCFMRRYQLRKLNVVLIHISSGIRYRSYPNKKLEHCQISNFELNCVHFHSTSFAKNI
jgi:hypothetical protein